MRTGIVLRGWLTAWAVAFGASSVLADTLVVNAGGSGDFTAIGDALAVANPGDTVRVEAGTYEESGLVITQPNLRLRGDDGAVIDGGCADAMAILIEADGVSVRSLTIRNAATGIRANGVAGVSIRDNVVEGAGIGIRLDEATDSSIRGNVVSGSAACEASGFISDRGIRSDDGGGNVISGNSSSGNDRDGYALDEDGDTLSDNVASNNGDEGLRSRRRRSRRAEQRFDGQRRPRLRRRGRWPVLS